MGALEGHGDTIALLARTLVGRSPAADVVVDHPSVSGEHCVLAWDGTSWTLRDLSSRNGTRHNGAPIEAGQSIALATGDALQLGRSDESFVLVDASGPATSALPSTVGQTHALHNAELVFDVSSDEEHAAWSVMVGSTVHALGDRAHTYLLLTLARARLEDAELEEPARGWRVADDLARGLSITPEVLKVYVYRARKQLEGAGIPDGSDVVQRRATSNQIRLGTDRIVIRRV